MHVESQLIRPPSEQRYATSGSGTSVEEIVYGGATSQSEMVGPKGFWEHLNSVKNTYLLKVVGNDGQHPNQTQP
jgi:hypothetical protein